MKRWTWLAMVAATSACSFPTSEFSVGTGQPDVVTVDNGAVDTGATDVVSPIDQGTTDVVASTDVVPSIDVVPSGDVVDSGAPGDTVPVADATDAGEPDVGDPGDVPPVDAGCPSPQIECAVAGASACVNPLDSLEHCGRCNYACNATNAAPVCTDGNCVLNCNAGFADCDSDPRNGCEVGLNTITNCGTCGTVCRIDERTSNSCVASRCVPVCNPGYGECDRNAANGCESSIATNLNCGSCGNACGALTTCGRGGTCTLTTTSPAYSRSAGPPFFEVCSNSLSTRLLPNQDDAAVLVPLPFNFSWWGTAYAAGAMVNVATNGFLSLQPAMFNNLSGIIPDPLAPDAVIAAWWTDLVTSPLGICTLTTGVAPNRRFYVQWGEVDYFSGRTGDMSFEIVLNETTNIVDLVYARVAAPPTGYVPTVGIESNNGNNAIVVCRSTDLSCPTVTSGTSFRFTPR